MAAEEPRAPGTRSMRMPSGRTLGLLLVGALVLGLLVSWAGAGEVLARLEMLGWLAPLLLAPYLVINTVDTIAWRRALPTAALARIPFRTMYMARIAGEAVNSLTPTATVGGEPLKAHLLRPWGVTGSDGAASVVIAKTALTLSQIAFILVGVPLLFARFGRPGLGAAVFALLLVLAAVFAWYVIRLQRRGLASTVWGWLHRIAPRSALVRRLEGKMQAIDLRLADFYRIERRAFVVATAWHFCGWLLGTFEVWMIMRWIGAPIPWIDALLIESLAQPMRAGALVIPGGLGAQEVGGVAICRLLGIADAPAVTLWLLKRARELFFDLVGVVYLAQWTALRRVPAVGGDAQPS